MKTTNQFINDKQFVVSPHTISFDGIDPVFEKKLKRKGYPQAHIYTIRDLLTQKECQNLISTAQNLGFQQAGLAIGQDLYRVKEKTRNNKRVIFEDSDLSQAIWNRMGHLVDTKYKNHKAVGLNWRFRVYEYPTGGIFAPHVDEQMDLGDGQITLFTFMIYLNDNMKGGETTFFNRRKKGHKKLEANRIIRPKTGMALIFDHLLFHEGSKVLEGKKYVLRSDLVYSK